VAKPPIVRVEWLDIASHVKGPWLRVKGMKPKPAECVAVGFLVAESDEAVSLAQSYSEGEAFGVWAYPRGCIRSITHL